MKQILSILFMLFLTSNILAQPRNNYELQFEIGKPFATIKQATGWKKEGDQWYSSLNQIRDIDHFNRYAFSLVEISYKPFLYFSIDFEHASNSTQDVENNARRLQQKDGALLPLNDYKKQIRNLDANNTLRFPLTNYIFIAADVLGLKLKLKEIDEYTDFTLVMRFCFYDNNTTRFLFYVESANGFIVGMHRDREYSDHLLLRKDDRISEIIKSDSLFENFYYEMNTDQFLDFIQAPLYK